MTFKQKAAILCMTASLLFAGCAKKSTEAQKEAPTPVTVEAASRGAIDHVIAADAVLYPINQANVTSKLSAPVKRVLVNRGDHVAAGKVLLELEDTDLVAAAAESKHQYEQAQAAYQTATGMTVLDDKTKAEADVRSARTVIPVAV